MSLFMVSYLIGTLWVFYSTRRFGVAGDNRSMARSGPKEVNPGRKRKDGEEAVVLGSRMQTRKGLTLRPKWHSRLIIILLLGVAACASLIGYMSVADNQLQAMIPGGERSGEFRLEPEYKRQLRRVVVSLAMRDTSLSRHHQILSNLPDYTRILMLLPEDNRDLIRSQLTEASYRDRVEFVPYKATSLNDSRLWLLFGESEELVQVDLDDSQPETFDGSMWAQDLFEVMTDSSDQVLLVQPLVHKWFYRSNSGPSPSITRDNLYVEALRQVGFATVTTPLSFYGGNILVDETDDGQRIAFCGSDVLTATGTVWNSFSDRERTVSKIIGDLKSALNVDQVIVPDPDNGQPCLMYHLDQAMLLLPDMVVAIPRLVGSLPEKSDEAGKIMDVKRFLTELRILMQRLGYRLVEIETSVQDVLNYRHSVNAIPYVDAQTDRKSLLMPVFISGEEDLEAGLIAGNRARLESLGYEVVFVPTNADELRGGIHCIVNVID